MEDHIDRLLESAPPAGFGACLSCMYLAGGFAALCSRCASRRLEPLDDHRCMICDQGYGEESAADCKNPLCNAGWREFDWNASIALRSGALLNTINRYKSGGRTELAVIFGRILVGYLDSPGNLPDPNIFRSFDLITATPTYVGSGGRTFDHTREVLVAAEKEAPGAWPFDLEVPSAVTLTAPPPKFKDIRRYQDRKEAAFGPYREALAVPDSARVHGKDVLIYDDIFTNGLVVNEVARALKGASAAQVAVVTLAREPWRR